MDFGEKMKLLRKQQGLTLEEVGARVGVGKSTVRKWESGQIANMRRDKIALVAKALGTTPGYLMGWEDSEATKVEPVQMNGPEMAETIRLLSELPTDVQKQVHDLVRTLSQSHTPDGDRRS